jgi:hypothetical protein
MAHGLAYRLDGGLKWRDPNYLSIRSARQRFANVRSVQCLSLAPSARVAARRTSWRGTTTTTRSRPMWKCFVLRATASRTKRTGRGSRTESGHPSARCAGHRSSRNGRAGRYCAASRSAWQRLGKRVQKSDGEPKPSPQARRQWRRPLVRRPRICPPCSASRNRDPNFEREPPMTQETSPPSLDSKNPSHLTVGDAQVASPASTSQTAGGNDAASTVQERPL